MPQIPNARKERFARFISQGDNQIDAYTKAGYLPNVSAASILANDPIIVERVTELKNQRSDLGISPELEEHAQEIVDPSKIDEDWVLLQMQDILQKAKSMGILKTARDVLVDITNIKGIGADKKVVTTEGNNNGALPAPTKTNLSLNIKYISEARNEIDRILEEAVDVTPKSGSLSKDVDESEQ